MFKRFYVEARKVSARKTIQLQNYESQFFPGWTDFYLVPFKESRFPLFGKKYSSRQSDALDPSLKDLARQGLISSTTHKRPICSEDLVVLYAASQLGLNILESLANSA